MSRDEYKRKLKAYVYNGKTIMALNKDDAARLFKCNNNRGLAQIKKVRP